MLSDRVVDLLEDGYDLAIRIASLPDSTLVGRRLANTRVVLCASPRHPAELAEHAVIGYRYWSMGDTWQFEGPGGRVSVKTRPCLLTNSGDTCRAMALAHQGVVLQPSFLVGADLAAGTLVELMPEFRTCDLGIHALFPTRKHVAPKVRALIDFLAQAFAESGRAW